MKYEPDEDAILLQRRVRHTSMGYSTACTSCTSIRSKDGSFVLLVAATSPRRHGTQNFTAGCSNITSSSWHSKLYMLLPMRIILSKWGESAFLASV
jgi:hypothetical protein